MDLPVSVMNEMSGSRFLFSGVGTQMITASTCLIEAEIGGGGKRFGLHRFGDGLGGNVLDVAAPGVQRLDFGRINVQPDDIHPCPRELQ